MSSHQLSSAGVPAGPRAAALAALLAMLAASNAVAGSDAPAEPLSSIAAVRQLTIAELGRGLKASVRGTVTRSGRYPVIQDGDAAIEIIAEGIAGPDGRLLGDENARQDWPPLGAVVEVEGHVCSNGCTPQLRADRFDVIGHGPLPAARPVALTAIFDSGLILQRVEVRGVVQAMRTTDKSTTVMHVESGGRRIAVRFEPALGPEQLDRFIDAEVSVVGVVLAVRNARGEFLAPWLGVSDPAAIEVVVPPRADPFAAPEIPLDAIARYRAEPGHGHRVRCRGTVTYRAAEKLFLQHGDRGVRVGLAAGVNTDEIAINDVVEVSGFVEMERFIGGISWAVCRRIGTAQAPPPLELDDAEFFAPRRHFGQTLESTYMGLYDGRLIRCRAVVAPMMPDYPRGLPVTLGRRDGPRADLVFETGIPDAIRRRLPPDTEIDVVSIMQVDLIAPPPAAIGWDVPLRGQVRLLVRWPEDVVVVRSPPWWTPRRLALMSGGLVAAVVAAAVWVAFLRREVRRQTARAVAEESTRKQAAIEHEAALRERSLIAADLHDTLLQTLTGIGYQLHVCRNSDGDKSPSNLAVAARLVDHASAQLRSTVWSLRAMPDARQPFAESVARLLELLAAGHPIAVSFHALGSAEPIHDLVARELLLVAQEAVSNAVHHGDPRRLEVSVAVDPASVELIIRDDGCGFDEAARPGPAEGHFGIVGMRERIVRLEGTLDIATAPGRGTTVTVRVSDPFKPPASRRDRFAMEQEAVR